MTTRFKIDLPFPSRMRKAALALASAGLLTMLAGCQDDTGLVTGAKEARPLKPEMLELMASKKMSKADPILVRIFKEDSTLEVWKRDSSGKYAMLKSYPICAWGGKIGPKIKEGDYQSPEGFYNVKPWMMNPRSQYYLSFDVGYPNSFDKAWGRTGAAIMVHGDCSSAGCFAMTDEQVAEIYALARESFAGGQTQFQVQSFPFHMTAENMAKHRTSPHYAFWKNIKEGYDHFEVSRLEPKVEVCDKRYVFDAVAKDGVTAFNPTASCPAYSLRPDLALAMADREKTEAQETQVAIASLEAADRAKADAEAKARADAEKARIEAAKPKSSAFSWLSGGSSSETAAPKTTAAINAQVAPQAAPAPAPVVAKPAASAPVAANVPAAKPGSAVPPQAGQIASSAPASAPAPRPAEEGSFWKRLNPFGS